VEAMRAAAQWSREALELHTIHTTCKCCGKTATSTSGVFVRFRHKKDLTAVRRINKDYRADPTDYLLAREQFIFDAFTLFCADCFMSPAAQIAAWEHQLVGVDYPSIEQQFARNRALLEDAQLQSISDPATLPPITALGTAFAEAKLFKLFGAASDDAAFDHIAHDAKPRLEQQAEDVAEDEGHYVKLCPRCESNDMHMDAREMYTCNTCGWQE